MPKCQFEISTGKFISGCMYDNIQHDPTKHVVIELPSYPDPRLHRLNASKDGIRDATAQELSDFDAVIGGRKASAQLASTKTKVLLKQIFQLRKLAEPSLTQEQFRQELVADFIYFENDGT